MGRRGLGRGLDSLIRNDNFGGTIVPSIEPRGVQLMLEPPAKEGPAIETQTKLEPFVDQSRLGLLLWFVDLLMIGSVFGLITGTEIPSPAMLFFGSLIIGLGALVAIIGAILRL